MLLHTSNNFAWPYMGSSKFILSTSHFIHINMVLGKSFQLLNRIKCLDKIEVFFLLNVPEVYEICSTENYYPMKACWLVECCLELCSVIFHLSRWRRGSRLDCGSEDPYLIPGIPSLCVGPLRARRLKTSLKDVRVPVSG